MYWLIFDTLKYANLDKSQIDEIIGSTSVPKIQKIIKNMLMEKNLLNQYLFLKKYMKLVLQF